MNDGRPNPVREDPGLRQAIVEDLEEGLGTLAARRAAAATRPPSPTAAEAPAAPTGALGEPRPDENADKPVPDRMEYAGTTVDNQDARKRVEKRLTPLDFEAILTEDRITQEVPIHPKALVVTYQTITNRESVSVVSMAEKEAAELSGTAKSRAGQTLLFQSVMSDYNLAAHLLVFNGRQLPSLSDKGKVDPAALQQRLELVRDRPNPVTEILQVHLRWFLDRVQRVGQDLEEHLGNG